MHDPMPTKLISAEYTYFKLEGEIRQTQFTKVRHMITSKAYFYM